MEITYHSCHDHDIMSYSHQFVAANLFVRFQKHFSNEILINESIIYTIALTFLALITLAAREFLRVFDIDVS